MRDDSIKRWEEALNRAAPPRETVAGDGHEVSFEQQGSHGDSYPVPDSYDFFQRHSSPALLPGSFLEVLRLHRVPDSTQPLS